MQRVFALAAALLALALLAACVTGGTSAVPDPSIDARTLDLSGHWKVRCYYTQSNHRWTGTVDLAQDGETLSGSMTWGRSVYTITQRLDGTVGRSEIVLTGSDVKRNFSGTYYPDTLTLAPASATELVGRAGDTGANTGNVKLWRE